jgi:trimeric autotransporter adhesin
MAQTREKGTKTLEERVAALESKLRFVTRSGRNMFITGANLHIINGLGSTDCGPEEEPIPDCPNGLGNLIVGYNELRPEGFGENIRTGSYNVVVGEWHNFSRFGGLVVGLTHTISGGFAVVSGGVLNTASANNAVVSGGVGNTASGVSSSVSGGRFNTASGGFAAVSGEDGNTASGDLAVVSGGRNRTAEGEFDWVAGDLFEDE